MPSERKFHRRVITVEVLSELPLGVMGLDEVHAAITAGNCSGKVDWSCDEEIDGPTCARLLQAQASEPGCFGLTEAGEDA